MKGTARRFLSEEQDSDRTHPADAGGEGLEPCLSVHTWSVPGSAQTSEWVDLSSETYSLYHVSLLLLSGQFWEWCPYRTVDICRVVTYLEAQLHLF